MFFGVVKILTAQGIIIMNKEVLDLEVSFGRVRKFQHQEYPELAGYNYTESCQYSKLWNENNILCRGIIFNDSKCIARPFPKFFNIEEISEDLSKKKIKYLQNKEDGSLIITYYHNGKVHFSTRGSFHSDQAKIAEAIWLEEHDKKIEDLILSHWTLLFELVGPSNVNVSRGYNSDELILLSMTSIQTGEEATEEFVEEMAKKLGCKRPTIFSANSINDLYYQIKENKDPNFEGIVVTFLDGMKVKIKSNLYIQLHKVITGVLGKDTKFEIWEEIKQNGKISIFEDLKIPDEFFAEITREVDIISRHYDGFMAEINSVFIEMKKDYDSGISRKDMALKWSNHRWLLSTIFLNQNDISTSCLKTFKKNYMDGAYG